jgi:hypothetical protein
MFLFTDGFFDTMTGMEVKGLTLKSRIRFIEQTYGKEGLRT